MRELAIVGLLFGGLYAAASTHREQPVFSVAPAVARDSAAAPSAPAAGMTLQAAGASLPSNFELRTVMDYQVRTADPSGKFEHPNADSVSLDERGGDLQSPAPQQVGHDAQAPAGAPESPLAGAFNNQPLTTLAASHVVNPQPACQCGESCPCCTLKKQAENFNVATEIKTPAPAQPPAPAYVPVSAPAAVGPQTYTYRPTWSGYYYAPSSCGPGGCGRASFGGFFRRGR